LSILLSGNRKSEKTDDKDLLILPNQRTAGWPDLLDGQDLKNVRTKATAMGTVTRCVRVLMTRTSEQIVIRHGPAPSPPGQAGGTGVRA